VTSMNYMFSISGIINNNNNKKIYDSWIKLISIELLKVSGLRIDCIGNFGNFSECSKDCGIGEKKRIYKISSQSVNNGVKCPHPNGFIDKQFCNTHKCPINCVGNFGEFDKCSNDCGGGTQTKFYDIKTHAKYGGITCPHLYGHTETQACNTQKCPDYIIKSNTIIEDNDAKLNPVRYNMLDKSVKLNELTTKVNNLNANIMLNLKSNTQNTLSDKNNLKFY